MNIIPVAGEAAWKRPSDEVDAEDARTIAIKALKQLIGRMETDKNPMNIIPVAGEAKMAMKAERNKLYEVLDAMKTAREGFISYKEFKMFVQEAEAEKSANDDSKKSKLVEYFVAMEHGKKMVKWPPPMFIPTISLVQMVFFFCASSEDVHRLQFDTDCILTHWWGYLTYSLIHLETSHLLLNVSLQLIVGLSLEMVHGTRRVIPLYVLGVGFNGNAQKCVSKVLSGSLAFFCFDCGAMIGASGGLYSLIAASISTCILNWNEDVAIFFTRFRGKKAPHACGGKLTRTLKLTGLLCFFAFDFGHAAYRRYADAGSTGSSVSVIAHSGGTITGILLGFIVLKNIKVERWEKTAKVLSSSLFFLLIGMAIGVNLSGSRRAAGIFSAQHCKNFTTSCIE